MGWIRNLSTGSKLTLSFGLMAALILLAGIVGVRGTAASILCAALACSPCARAVDEREKQGLKGREVFEFAQAKIREYS